MRVHELKKIIQDLPDDMHVTVPVGESLTTACAEGWEVAEVCNPDNPDEREEVLILNPCRCNDQKIDANPETFSRS